MPSFPEVAPGVITGAPYTTWIDIDVTKVELPCGLFDAYVERPADQGWNLAFPALTKAQIDILTEFWDDRRGSLLTFDFIDPDSGAAHVARFDQDRMDVRAVEYGVYSTQLSVRKVSA